jgi:exonuclease III
MIYLATWNVKSLFRANVVKELVNELKKYKMMIAAIQEIRRPRLRWLGCIENDKVARLY